MSFLHGLPSSVSVGEYVAELSTEALFWLRVLSEADSLKPNEQAYKLLTAVERITISGTEIPLSILDGADMQALYERLAWFSRGGDKGATMQGSEGAGGEPVLDFAQDFAYIYSAFRQVYRINLLKEPLHWWEFLALLETMPSGCQLVDYLVHYRGIDVSTMPGKTQAERKERQRILDIQKRIRINQPRHQERQEAPYVMVARRMKAGEWDLRAVIK